MPVSSTLSFPLSNHVWLSRGSRFYCTLTDGDVKKRVEEITDLFFEARELLDDAVCEVCPTRQLHYISSKIFLLLGQKRGVLNSGVVKGKLWPLGQIVCPCYRGSAVLYTHLA